MDMEIGNKIRYLRCRSGLTQEQLGERLGLSAQAISKWETGVSLPDITMLPALAEEFGVSIDELFDLTADQKLKRIENRMEIEEELPPEVFREYEEFLKARITKNDERAAGLLAHMYHHRMCADAKRVSCYARRTIMDDPGKKDCQWLLGMAEGQAVWDWNESNNAGLIDFYKQVVESAPQTALPYYYLIDNLIADRRTAEAREYLKKLKQLKDHKPFMILVYMAHIALAEFDEPAADALIDGAFEKFGEDGGFLFEAAQYHARKCEYDDAIELYEASFESEKKPRYIDALSGIAAIYEIRGEYEKAAETQDRIIAVLKDEWGFTDELRVKEAENERARLGKKGR